MHYFQEFPETIVELLLENSQELKDLCESHEVCFVAENSESLSSIVAKHPRAFYITFAYKRDGDNSVEVGEEIDPGEYYGKFYPYISRVTDGITIVANLAGVSVISGLGNIVRINYEITSYSHIKKNSTFLAQAAPKIAAYFLSLVDNTILLLDKDTKVPFVNKLALRMLKMKDQQIEDIEKQIAETRALLIKQLEHRKKHTILQSQLADTREKIEKEILAGAKFLAKDSLVQSIIFESTFIKIFTVPIAIPAGGCWFYLGRYLLSIDVLTTNVTVVSLDNISHPHIENSKICWGETSQIIANAAAQLDLLQTCKAVLAWIESVNIADTWGKRLLLYPTIPEDSEAVRMYKERHKCEE